MIQNILDVCSTENSASCLLILLGWWRTSSWNWRSRQLTQVTCAGQSWGITWGPQGPELGCFQHDPYHGPIMDHPIPHIDTVSGWALPDDVEWVNEASTPTFTIGDEGIRDSRKTSLPAISVQLCFAFLSSKVSPLRENRGSQWRSFMRK